MTAETRNRILLVGMMGSGKSTVGQLLAKRLGWAYRDSDQDVEATTGLTVPQLMELEGEAAFRRAEADVLARACAMDRPVVVSAAGGCVLNADNRRLLRASGTVVWLRARPETNALRVGDGTGRPLLGNDPAEAMARLYMERAPLYVEVAHVVIDVDELTPDTVVDRLLEAVEAETADETPASDLGSPVAARPDPPAQAGAP
jgi:shikimate kinase